MSKRIIGAITIGQSPRPDLVAPLQQMTPHYRLIQAGALDNLTAADLPDVTQAAYPLTTRLQTGAVVNVEEQFLAPHLQTALNNVERQGATATLLLCAGTFQQLTGTRPLFKPFNIACTVLQTSGIKQIGVVCPIPEQEPPVARRWTEAGFQVSVWAAPLNNPHLICSKADNCEAVVLDYVGHATSDVLRLQRTLHIPVIDLGHLAMAAMAGTL